MIAKLLTVGELREFLDRENVPNTALLMEGQYGFCTRCGELYLDSDGDVVMPDGCNCNGKEEEVPE